eukprot:gb/GEZN01005128.1/.p1 GENE.gb/GEZN01005128.1/~~gb/GEZN01005128.1/.p1  ORF type:complete len:584 (+),score=108.92 gb/GEZN01005128.1/:90-1841(+)
MGSVLAPIFIEVAKLPQDFGGFFQVLFLSLTYSFILFQAANYIADGSELLLLLPSLGGLVGSIVLPVLGVLPDAALILFSGLGPKEEAQAELSVGVGALAGSTIMLLTIPWFLILRAGAVDITRSPWGGPPLFNYKVPHNSDGSPGLKLTPGQSLSKSGVQPFQTVQRTALAMMLTAITYALIQGPTFFLQCGKQNLVNCHGQGEKYWALAGMVLCCVFFVAYLRDQVLQQDSPDRRARKEVVIEQAIGAGLVDFVSVFSGSDYEQHGASSLKMLEERDAEMHDVLKRRFARYDRDQSGHLDAIELTRLCEDLRLRSDARSVSAYLKAMDHDLSGHVSFEEFEKFMITWVSGQDRKEVVARPGSRRPSKSRTASDKSDKQLTPNEEKKKQPTTGGVIDTLEEEEEEEEEDYMPDDLADLPPAQRMFRVKLRAFWMMFLGTTLVLIFADPMVGCLHDIGKRCNISPFFISFILAPIASNSSEVVASYVFSRKKTRKSASLSLGMLYGAATMNNTVGLAVFLGLIFFKGLIWEYSAETLVILFVQICMTYFGLKAEPTQLDACLVLCLYPFSILLVVLLERAGLN